MINYLVQQRNIVHGNALFPECVTAKYKIERFLCKLCNIMYDWLLIETLAMPKIWFSPTKANLFI